jgi:hypothetical protein
MATTTMLNPQLNLSEFLSSIAAAWLRKSYPRSIAWNSDRDGK